MSEVKTMSSIQFPNTQQPYQVNDARIPANPGAYKYMATDGNGDWVPADRLAWKDEKRTEIMNDTVGGFAFIEGPDVYSNTTEFLSPFGAFDTTKKYVVVFDGVEYKGLSVHDTGSEEFWIGAPINVEDGTHELSVEMPFNIMVFSMNPEGDFGLDISTILEGEEHSIQIYELGETVRKIPEEYLPAGAGVTIYTATNEYLYKDYETGEKVSKAELAEAAQTGAVVLKNYNGSAYHPAIVEFYESNDFGSATYISHDGTGGTNAFSFYTKEYVAGPM